MFFADNAGPDQPAHIRRLFLVFVVRLQSQWYCICNRKTALFLLSVFARYVLDDFYCHFGNYMQVRWLSAMSDREIHSLGLATCCDTMDIPWIHFKGRQLKTFMLPF